MDKNEKLSKPEKKKVVLKISDNVVTGLVQAHNNGFTHACGEWNKFHDQEMKAKDVKWMEFIKPTLDAKLKFMKDESFTITLVDLLALLKKIDTLAEKTEENR